jgi:glycyl-tRNA synthetase beta chain
MQNALLIELFTEELPPKSLKALGQGFQEHIVSGLQARGLVASGPAQELSEGFATPRRLGVVVHQVASEGSARQVEAKGPSTKVGLDANGQPTQALVKWAEKQGTTPAQLVQGNDGKQDCFYYRSSAPGERLAEVIQSVIEEAMAKLPIPKFMNYQLADGVTTVNFVRPAHRLIVLHGTQVVPCTILGLSANRITQGHRFLANSELSIDAPASYEALLESQGKVLASFGKRKALIRQALLAESKKLGARLSSDPKTSDEQALDTTLEGYVDEVCALVEWPVAYVGAFEEHYLAVPQECLILTMRTNQKYFPLFDQNGKLSPRFLIISNMQVANPSSIIDGNQRVVRPRLADAQFFFDQDKKQTLANRVDALGQVVYHAKLGTQAARMQRVRAIASALAKQCAQDATHVERAATLAKTDLLTDMVGEFPELQGIMGRYYALHDGEAPQVCEAIAEHYQPRFAGDALPASSTGLLLALADKLETLTGIWGIGMQPTGDRDPFALRRHALGVVRMLLERKLPLTLSQCLQLGFDSMAGLATVKGDVPGLQSFVVERLRGYLRDQGFETKAVEAVLALNANQLDDIAPRLNAVREFAKLPQAPALAAANKRIGNILRKQTADGTALTGQAKASLLQEPAEKALFDELAKVQVANVALMKQGLYTQALSGLAQLREPVDQFFDSVMVMAEDEKIRHNRLTLLAQLHLEMNRVAELSLLAN